jgi:uncharacterized protein (TIGR02996 family)
VPLEYTRVTLNKLTGGSHKVRGRVRASGPGRKFRTGAPVSDAAFLQQLDLHPDDDTLRLVYADWLDERDDPRGPFLRAALALHSLATGDEHGAELRRTVLALRDRVSAGWLVRVLHGYAEDDVREAVFRFHAGEVGLARGYLFVDGTDPSWYLFGRLAGSYPSIRPGSERTPLDRTEDTGCFLGGPRWVGELSCDVDFGIAFDPQRRRRSRHRVELRGEEWVITDSRGIWIS